MAAYQEGYEAFYVDSEKERDMKNPYPETDPQHVEYHNGWHDADEYESGDQ